MRLFKAVSVLSEARPVAEKWELDGVCGEAP